MTNHSAIPIATNYYASMHILFKKENILIFSIFNSSESFFLCMLSDYSKTPESIWIILFLFERVYLTGGPMVTIRSRSNNRIVEKSKESFKFYRHTYKDMSIFLKNSCVCVQKSLFDNEDHRWPK